MIAALSWPIQPLHAARYFDRRLNFYDRLATAVELAGEQIPGSLTFRRFQWQDTLARANNIKISEFIPIKVPWPELVVTILVFISLLPIQKLAAERFSQAAISQEIEAAIDAESVKLSELLSEVEGIDTLTPETLASLQEQLERTIEQLSRAESLEPALAALEDSIEGITQLQNPSVQYLDEVLKSIGDRLSNESDPQRNALAEALNTGEASTVADALSELANNLPETEAVSGLANTLTGLRNGLDPIDPDLANTISAAVSALEDNDIAGAQTVLEEAAAQLDNLAEEQSLEGEFEDVAAVVTDSRDRLLENAGILAGNTPGQTQNNGPSNPGSTSGDNGGQGSGAGSGTSAQTDTDGMEAGLDPIGTQNQAGDGGEAPFTSLFIPDNLGGSDSNGVLLPGQGEVGEQILGQTPGEIDSTEGSRVPYQEVFPTYEEAFREAIETGQIPNHLVDLVRTYFSSLEP
jgi:hypothetical protein